MDSSRKVRLPIGPREAEEALMSLSAYELERARNIAANRQRLIELGIESDVAAIKTDAAARKPIKGGAQNKKTKEVVPPRSRSLRQQNLDPSGQHIPEKPVMPPPETVQRRVRKPAVPLDASKVSTGTTSAEEATAFLARLSEQKVEAPASKKQKKSVKIEAPSKQPAAASPINVSALDLHEDDVAKLVPERIYSLEVHPDASRLLVVAGDTWGKVGLWDVDAGDDMPVVTFEPHSRPVAGMRVPPHLPHLLVCTPTTRTLPARPLFSSAQRACSAGPLLAPRCGQMSCSHDGTVRCIDLGGGGGSFYELYRAPDPEEDDAPTLHGFSRTAGEGGALAVCRNEPQGLNPGHAPLNAGSDTTLDSESDRYAGL